VDEVDIPVDWCECWCFPTVIDPPLTEWAEVLVSLKWSRRVLETDRPPVVPPFIPLRILSVVVEDVFDSLLSSMSSETIPTLPKGSAKSSTSCK